MFEELTQDIDPSLEYSLDLRNTAIDGSNSGQSTELAFPAAMIPS
jgi:hypothetical protein